MILTTSDITLTGDIAQKCVIIAKKDEVALKDT